MIRRSATTKRSSPRRRLPKLAGAGLAVMLVAGAAAQEGPGVPAPSSGPPDPGLVVLDPKCLSDPALRRGRLTRQAFGLPAELYLNAIDRKLERTYGLHQPRSGEDGIAPGGRVTLELVLDARGRLCGYRSLTPDAHPTVVETAARHLESSAPFPPLPPDVLERLDAVQIHQSWAYTPRATTEAARHRLQIYGSGGTESRRGGARYELAIPFP